MTAAHTRDVTVKRDGELHIDGLPLRAGDHVRVYVIPGPASISVQNPAHSGNAAGDQKRYPFHGRVLRYDDPFEPAIDPDEWEANR